MKLIYIDESKLPPSNKINCNKDCDIEGYCDSWCFEGGQQSILSQSDLMPYMDEIVRSYFKLVLNSVKPEKRTPLQYLQECASALPLRGLTIEQIQELKK